MISAMVSPMTRPRRYVLSSFRLSDTDFPHDRSRGIDDLTLDEKQRALAFRDLLSRGSHQFCKLRPQLAPTLLRCP